MRADRITGSGTPATVTAECGSGKRPIAGGFSGNVNVSQPTSTGWYISGIGSMSAFAVCVNAQ